MHRKNVDGGGVAEISAEFDGEETPIRPPVSLVTFATQEAQRG